MLTNAKTQRARHARKSIASTIPRSNTNTTKQEIRQQRPLFYIKRTETFINVPSTEYKTSTQTQNTLLFASDLDRALAPCCLAPQGNVIACCHFLTGRSMLSSRSYGSVPGEHVLRPGGWLSYTPRATPIPDAGCTESNYLTTVTTPFCKQPQDRLGPLLFSLLGEPEPARQDIRRSFTTAHPETFEKLARTLGLMGARGILGYR